MIRPIKHCWCGTIAEGNTDQCASHNAEDRKNDRYAKKVKVVRQIQKVTVKRAKQNQEYKILSSEYLAGHPCCEVDDCYLKSVEVHHKKGRANDLLTDETRFFAVCRKHHELITTNSKWAIDNGYSELRTV